MTIREHKLKKDGIDVTDGDFVRVGKEANHTEVSKTDGSVRLRGESTAWRDMIADLFGKRLNSTAGKVNYDYDENLIRFLSGGSISVAADRVGGNQEINHEFKVGSSIILRPHIHWFQPVISHSPDVLDTKEYELTARWRLARNGHGINLSDPWNTIVLTSNLTNNIFDATYADGKDYLNQITRFPDIVIDCKISDTIQFQMARTDALGDEMLLYFFDLHGKIDSHGSEDEVYKRP
jgi:hypothetical protein